jgi:hypothetical protein
MASRRALAAALGISVAGAHKAVLRGMPADNIEDARAWYRTNGRGKLHMAPKRPRAGLPQPPPAPAPAAPPQPEPPPEDTEISRRAEEAADEPVKTFTDSDNCREALREQHLLRKHAASQASRLSRSGDVEASRRWHQTHQQYFGRVATYEKMMRDILDRDGVTMQFAEAQRTFRTVLQDVRTLAAAMPAAMAAKVNPGDPILAQKLLEEWRDKTLFKILYEDKEPTAS